MPPCTTPIFVAPDAPIVPEAVPLESYTELKGDVMEIQWQMNAERKRLKDAVKTRIEELREKKQKERLTGKKTGGVGQGEAWGWGLEGRIPEEVRGSEASEDVEESAGG